MNISCSLQIASYELGKLLPEDQRPLPLDLLRIGDSRSDVVPNGGGSQTFQPMPLSNQPLHAEPSCRRKMQ